MVKYIKKNRKMIGASVLIVILFTILIALIIAIKFTLNLHQAQHDSYQPVKHSTTNEDIKINDSKQLKNRSFLILGLDKMNDGSQRTDSIIIATYHVKDNVVIMTRIPRDLYIKTDDYEGKINALYDAKGLAKTIDTIQDYVGLPISNYATTDFKGLTKMVDHIGGIDINSDIKIDDSNNYNLDHKIYVHKGKNHLNGTEALGYSRIRYVDNDIERGNRQMDVIKAIINKMTRPNELLSVDNNIKFMSQYIKTDMKISTAIDYAVNVKSTPKIKKLSFDWDSFDYEGQSYVKLSMKERAKISKQLRKSMNLDEDSALVPIQNEPK